MKFTLDPPSGYADSYLDVKFVIEFDHADKVEVCLFNETVKQPIEILAVTHGYISDGTIAIIKHASEIEGFINIFNRDKMNSSLKNYTSIEISCKLKIYHGEQVNDYEIRRTFYNESKSLDSEVIPFDLQIHNSEINLSQNESLKLSMISSEDRLYELILKNEQGNRKCIFEVFAKKGRTDISVPSEILFSDLDISSIKRDRSCFDLYWTKFEGVDYSKFMNRKLIKILDGRICLLGKKMLPKPQTRLGPVNELSSDFVLSDRYFVHTYKDFSGFGSKSFDSVRMKRLTFFYYETLDLSSKKVTPGKNDSRIQNILSQNRVKKINDSDSKITNLGFSNQKQFLSTFSPVFSQSPKHQNSNLKYAKKHNVKSGGCAGCGRKKL